MPASRLRLCCLILVLLLGASSRLPGQPPASAAPPATAAAADAPAEPAQPTEQQLHEELRGVRAAMEKALNERDLDGLLTHLAPKVVFSTMNGDVARGPEAIRAYFKKMLEGDTKVVEKVTTHFEPDDLSIFYGNTAVAFGRSDDHYELVGGQTFDIKARWTATLVRQDGRWLIAAFHYSANVFDNPILATQRSILIKVALFAVLVAFLVALLIGRALRKKAAAAG